VNQGRKSSRDYRIARSAFPAAWYRSTAPSFRKGLTLAQSFRLFLDDTTAEKWIADLRWNGEPAYPRCSDTNVQSGAKHPTMPYRCRGCRMFFSVKTGTVMQSSKLGCHTWVIATYLLATGKGQASMKLHRDLGITQKTGWHLAHRIRESWASRNLCSMPRLRSMRRTSAAWRRTSTKRRSSGRDRGPVGKTAVVAAKDRETMQVSAQVVDSTDKETLQIFVAEHVVDDDVEGCRIPTRRSSTASAYVRGMAHAATISGARTRSTRWRRSSRGWRGSGCGIGS
jgi:transposase-like protein